MGDDKPRKMIMAMEKGPGPAKYVLPSLVGWEGHDPSKYINPSFSLGPRLRPAYIPKTWGPGPSAYSYSGKVTRYGRGGKCGDKVFTLGARIAPLRDFTNAPGPGAYRPTKYHYPKAPAFRLKSRVVYSKCDDVPPPNTYTLPPTMGIDLALYKSNQGFSQRGRVTFGSFQYDYAKSPGPACCKPSSVAATRGSGPSFTIKGRLPYVIKSIGPGPCAHSVGPGKHKTCAPRFSFGQKHSEFVAPVLFAMS